MTTIFKKYKNTPHSLSLTQPDKKFPYPNLKLRTLQQPNRTTTLHNQTTLTNPPRYQKTQTHKSKHNKTTQIKIIPLNLT